MCGIVGIFRPDRSQVAKTEVEAMLSRIAYRGPDGIGFHIADGIGLGHVRLAIQDLSDLAAQPMVSHNGRYVFVYNGEIYNIVEMKDDLRKENVSVNSTGDTEVLLEYLATFGLEAALKKAEGMFAFALWDVEERTLALARDRYGIKPLVYTRGSNGEVRFASEMKALFDGHAEPDLITLNATLLGLGCTWGDPTVFRHIYHVGAGEWLVFRADGRTDRGTFCSIADFADESTHRELCGLSEKAVVDRVAHDLEESVKFHLLSDAPVATLASGGVDSSIVSAIAAKYYPNLKLYHASVLSEIETPAAEQLAKVLGVELHAVRVTDEDILNYIPIVTYYNELPLTYLGGSYVPFFMVSRLAGTEGIKVVLTGEGSDEYFLGYPKYALRPYLHAYNRMVGFLQKGFQGIPKFGRFLWPSKETEPASLLRNLMFRYELEERRGSAAEAFHFVRNKTELDWHVCSIDMVIGNVRTLLHRNDRLAMAWGLESRFPFLGHTIARTAVNLPGRYKIRKSFGFRDWRHPMIIDKWAVRAVAGRYLPPNLAQRRKFGLQSSAHLRLHADRRFFDQGFMTEYYGLNRRAFDHLYAIGDRPWLAQVFLLEVWGQIFALGRSVDAVRERIRQYATIDPK